MSVSDCQWFTLTQFHYGILGDSFCISHLLPHNLCVSESHGLPQMGALLNLSCCLGSILIFTLEESGSRIPQVVVRIYFLTIQFMAKPAKEKQNLFLENLRGKGWAFFIGSLQHGSAYSRPEGVSLSL